MNLKRYVINYSKLILHRIPVDLRFDDVVAYLNLLVSPIVYVYTLLLSLREQLIYRLTITPQVVYLEKLLNDRWDNAERRIYIIDGPQYDLLYLYTKAELQPVHFYRASEDQKVFIFTKGEASQITFDFVIYVPNDVTFDTAEMTALVKDYRLAGKLFTIQTFVP